MIFAVASASEWRWRWVLAIVIRANGKSGGNDPCAWLALSCKAVVSRIKRPRKWTGPFAFEACVRAGGGGSAPSAWEGRDVRAGQTLAGGGVFRPCRRSRTARRRRGRRACLFRDGVEARRGAVVSCERLLAYPNYQRTPCLKEHLGLEPADAYRFLRRREALASFFCV